MAQIFHGFFLDKGAGSLGLSVGEYFIRKARQAKSNLLVASYLNFSGNSKDENEAIFAKRWGVNCIVREEGNIFDSYNLNNSLYWFSQTSDFSIGSLPPHTVELD